MDGKRKTPARPAVAVGEGAPKDIKMTMRYAHLVPAHKLAAVDRLVKYRKEQEKAEAKKSLGVETRVRLTILFIRATQGASGNRLLPRSCSDLGEQVTSHARIPLLFQVAQTGTEVMAEDRSQMLTFLYRVIDDDQAMIRFLDTKAAFGIAVLGAMVSKLLDRDQLVARAYQDYKRCENG